MSDEDAPPTETDDTTNPRKKRIRKRKRKDPAESNLENDATVAVCTTTDEPELDRTVFVEGIPFTATKEDVLGFFTKDQNVPIIDCRLPTFPDTGRLRGYGHVVFASVADQARALERNGDYMGERYLSVQPAKAPKQQQSVTEQQPHNEPSCVLVLHNLSYDATEDDLQPLFQKVVTGGIRVVRHNATKRSRGFAYVQFESVEAATRAIAEPILVLGRPCRVDYDHGNMGKSFRTETGRLWNKKFKVSDGGNHSKGHSTTGRRGN
jgi:nucleolin